MKEQDLFYLLALQRVEGIGDIMAKKLLTHFGDSESIFKAKATQLTAIDGVGSILLKNLNIVLILIIKFLMYL